MRAGKLNEPVGFLAPRKIYVMNRKQVINKEQ